ncbi:SRPBCC family protein [Novosphingobium kaempferiae]|uniref:SRPBCC family protein n=1 Tax=Novosphingobium kaempferiae TaxID=2896849 RepID=UPI001E586603|nr:SRPBCC family protein [Novosphingobium kaempferiae]
MKLLASVAAVLVAVFAPATASANVARVDANGFVIRHVVQLSASAEEAWAVLGKPSVWWDSEHTWSGDAANLSLDARAGGCFCEILPNASSKTAAPRGSVEHMRVIYVEKPRALRMLGSLGPLQSEAVNATLTVQLKPDAKGGTQMLLEYVVGGYARTPFDKLAPAVDGVLAEQLKRLSGKLGGAFAEAFPAIEPDAAATLPVAEPEAQPEPPVNGEGDVLPLAPEPPANTGKIIGR